MRKMMVLNHQIIIMKPRTISYWYCIFHIRHVHVNFETKKFLPLKKRIPHIFPHAIHILHHISN